MINLLYVPEFIRGIEPMANLVLQKLTETKKTLQVKMSVRDSFVEEKLTIEKSFNKIMVFEGTTKTEFVTESDLNAFLKDVFNRWLNAIYIALEEFYLSKTLGESKMFENLILFYKKEFFPHFFVKKLNEIVPYYNPEISYKTKQVYFTLKLKGIPFEIEVLGYKVYLSKRLFSISYLYDIKNDKWSDNFWINLFDYLLKEKIQSNNNI